MTKYRNIELPTKEAMATLIKKARSRNSDNAFTLDGVTGKIISMRYISRQGEDTMVTPSGCYDVNISSTKTIVSETMMLDLVKAHIDLAIDYGLEV